MNAALSRDYNTTEPVTKNNRETLVTTLLFFSERSDNKGNRIIEKVFHTLHKKIFLEDIRGGFNRFRPSTLRSYSDPNWSDDFLLRSRLSNLVRNSSSYDRTRTGKVQRGMSVLFC